MDSILTISLFLPLISALINGLFCRRISNRNAGFIASICLSLAAISSLWLFVHCAINKNILHIVLLEWLNLSEISVNWAIYMDQITAMMFLLVNIVSCVVHIYSLGYMEDDKTLPKFLAYLSLFTFCMLSLVSADNFLQLFFGWEGVGACSYLLIGYYYYKDSACDAAIKAFIVNRVGDLAFIIAIFMIVIYAGSLDFEDVFILGTHLAQMNLGSFFGLDLTLLDVLCLLLFIGCMGKSAQIGLHIWLPDAMEGPTPVSALIHAATMVTAGVFVVCRCSFLFEYSQITLNFITIIGAVTCLFAALVAIAQKDIKKIIAYSTCSQLGYMFIACGSSAYQAAMFHLFTHGFFKALLFLSAGSVIHATHEQEITKMGGIAKKLPFTYANFWLGSLAIMGIFPLAGFYSKDMVLEHAYMNGDLGRFAFNLGIFAAILTAIYSMKIIYLTFHGRTKLSQEQYAHVHESPLIMNMPLMLLVLGSVASGMFCYYILQIGNPYGLFSNAIFILPKEAKHVPHIIELLPMLVGLVGMVIGLVVYGRKMHKPLAKHFSIIHKLLQGKFFFDEIFQHIFVRFTYYLSHLSNICDKNVIDRFGPHGSSFIVRSVAGMVAKIQTGYIFNYATYIIFSLIICLTFFIVQYIRIAGV